MHLNRSDEIYRKWSFIENGSSYWPISDALSFCNIPVIRLKLQYCSFFNGNNIISEINFIISWAISLMTFCINFETHIVILLKLNGHIFWLLNIFKTV